MLSKNGGGEKGWEVGVEKRAHCFLFPSLWGKSSALSRALSVALMRGDSHTKTIHICDPKLLLNNFYF